MKSYEVNFDGLVGQTHNYAGLSTGNVASMNNAKDKSYPKEAAKQGLDKMKAVRDLGLVQGVLAPQQRPDLDTLRRLGFTGSDSQVIEKAFKKAPHLLNACYSASSMWTANAATISPGADTKDGKVHITPANLINKFHRSIEPPVTSNILRAIFSDDKVFCHHDPLPSGDYFGDEGAANHTRLCEEYGKSGVEFFVFGKNFYNSKLPRPKVFDARQTFEASSAIARLHQLDERKVVYAQQNPEVIDKGVFHNDVIGVGNRQVYFYHEESFLDKARTINELRQVCDFDLNFIEVKSSMVSVEDAVSSYLFNSQLISLENGETNLIAPEECKRNERVYKYIQDVMLKETAIKKVHFYNVTQSMKNGGGPACLRLRVALNDNELKAVNSKTLLTDELYSKLHKWIDKNYRDEFSQSDFADPKLITEVQSGLDELTQILGLGSVYPFQKP